MNGPERGQTVLLQIDQFAAGIDQTPCNGCDQCGARCTAGVQMLAAEYQAIEAELARTLELVLAVTGHARLLDDLPVLRQAVSLRNPYVDAVSFLQLRFLTELRQPELEPAGKAGVAELVLRTVTGVAAGLQITG